MMQTADGSASSDANGVDKRFVHIFFLDGVGLGSADARVNPFVSAQMPHLSSLIGRPDWFLAGNEPLMAERATLVPTDATMSVPGRPQSATGQATILSGFNVPLLIGEHYGPKPNGAVAEIIRKGTIFDDIAKKGGKAALITPYPQGYFDAISSGKRLYSAIPLAVTNAGWRLFTYEDLLDGRAVSPDFTNEGWRDVLGYGDVDTITPYHAGQRIAEIAAAYDLSFFEHWPSDRRGHRGTMDEAIAHLERIDKVIGGLLSNWPDDKGVLIITSDHGNIEEKNHRQHTRNPVPTIIVGKHHVELARTVANLADIAGVARSVLGLKKDN